MDFILPKGEPVAAVPALSQMEGRTALQRLCDALFGLREDWLTMHFHNQKDKQKKKMVDQLFQTGSHDGRKHPSKVWLQMGEQETEELRRLTIEFLK